MTARPLLALALVVTACTVGAEKPPAHPRPVPVADRMPEAVLDQYDPDRKLERDEPGLFDQVFSGGRATNVCGSMCNPCRDATSPPSQPGCLNQLACSGGGGADPLVIALAIAAISAPRRSRRRRR